MENFLREKKRFHQDLLTLKDTMKEDRIFATDIYKALSNMRWRSKVTDDIYSCTWRFAGGLVAQIREMGENYLDFYCSGDEGHVTARVKDELDKLGWEPLPYEPDL